MINSAKKIKVFVVDDDNLTIDLMVKPFQESGFINFFGRANSGEECLSRLKGKTVDLILMDINMPGINGIETVERLLQIPDITPPKIIFLTVYGDQEYVQKAFDLKASLLGKNIGIDYLMSTIQRVAQGEIVINPNPNGVIKTDINAKLKFTLKRLFNKEQLAIAQHIRDGMTANESATLLNCDVYHINNQRKEIKKKLERIKENINAAYLGALFERSGLFPPLEINNLDQVLANAKKSKL